MTDQIRIVLAYGPKLIRESLSLALGRQRHLKLVAEAATAEETLRHAEATQPDVVLLDLNMPGGGSALVAGVSRAAPVTGIVAVTSADNNEPAEVVKAGARGYLDLNCDVHELVRSIERVSAGDMVILARTTAETTELGSLTSREQQVLQLVAHGCTNSEIGRELCITSHTVKGHLAKILNKLTLQNRVQLAAYAMQARVVREPVRLQD